jgi:hypothetical protein
MIFRDKFIVLYVLRFLSLLIHAVTTTWLYQIVPVLVKAGLSEDATHEGYITRETTLIAFISLSLVCLSVDALFLVSGLSLRSPLITLFHVVFHSLGSFFTLWILLDAWPWQSVPYVYAFFIFPPFTVELICSSPIQPTVSVLKRSGGVLAYGCRILFRFTLYICEYTRQMLLQRTYKPQL